MFASSDSSHASGSRRARCAYLVIALLAIGGCGSGAKTQTNPPPPPPPPNTDTTAPSVPTNLTATAASSSRVDLSWTASTDTGSGIAGYRIYRNGAASALATVTTTAYADATVAANTPYAYVVRAFDVAGNESAVSNTANVTTPASPAGGDTTPPTTPTNLTATASASNRIDLAWTASTDTGGSGLAGYRIYRNGSTTVLANVTTATYADTSVVANTAYSYVVRAVDGAGNQSSPSTSVSATTPAGPSSPSGLDSRPSNTTCVAWAKDGSSQLQVPHEFATLRTFNRPIGMFQAPGINTHWHVVEQGGVISRFSISNPTAQGTTTFIDIGDRVYDDANETGLLGMAFHPKFPTDRRVFLSYTTTDPGRLTSRISSFIASADGATLDRATENILLTANQPANNHNGGHIAFGPDGYLYIGFGDGGGSNDPNANGQRLTTLHGKLLRIDVNVDAATKYAVPTSNPYFNPASPNDKCPTSGTRDSGTCPEIYAYGLRNPWRWSFDRTTGDLWLADVGQNRYEEVNRIVSGGNYGWSCREGAHNATSGNSCTGATIDPVTEYDHDDGFSITGGFVYRGTQNTNLVGRYIFGDFGTGRIWAWIEENATNREPTQLLDSSLGIASFAQGNDGELYALDYNDGTIHRLVFQTGSGGTSAPNLLSATGCVNPSNATQPASGLIPYDINAPFWSDGAAKNRWIALPNNTQVTVGANGHWQFPNGTVLLKEFRNNTRLIETRLFMRHSDGTWGGFTYEWNAAQTDATLLQAGATRTIDGQTWIFPSEAQCMQCHTATAGRSLGPETAQLNRSLRYPQTGRTANQLATLSAIGVLTPAMTDPAAAPSMPRPDDTNAPLANRARAYLHTNCAQCHRPSGPTQSNMDLRYTTTLAAMNTCNVTPQLGDLGLGAAARLIVPGNPDASVLVNRVNRRDEHGMPPVGSALVDAAGVEVLRQWVAGLSGC